VFSSTRRPERTTAWSSASTIVIGDAGAAGLVSVGPDAMVGGSSALCTVLEDINAPYTSPRQRSSGPATAQPQ
jgi:hypothetical protein